MCGIAGFVGHSLAREDVACAMARQLSHRGPDGYGVWHAADAGPTLVHTRLAIVDLDQTGAQPMHSRSGRYTITFNGEIYNYANLRSTLETGENISWQGSSDTEVLLAAIDAWGLDATLPELTGMFAFSVWDSQLRELHLVRDRFGEKPLYAAPLEQGLVFASELSALREHPGISAELSVSAVRAYLRHGSVPAPRSIYRGVYKLEPGTTWCWSANRAISARRWWSTSRAALAGRQEPFEGTDAEAVDTLDDRLREAVSRQMLADVPLGAFLSGGVDSSLIVALMQSITTQPVRTFSMGFRDPRFDEAPYAKAVAAELGTDHVEHYVNTDDVLGVVEELPRIYSEPHADSSQLPTVLVARLARQHVTVALSGDAGDEVFAGYNRHVLAAARWPTLARIPLPLRGAAASLLASLPGAAIDRIAPFLPGLSGLDRPGEKLHRDAELIAAQSVSQLYDGLSSVWRNPDEILGDVSDEPLPEFLSAAQEPDSLCPDSDPVAFMMLRDQLGYLPNDILEKVDRAAMSCSLETRVPFLDHHVVEFAWSIPESMRVRSGRGKWLSRTLLARYLPTELIDRPKAGFSIPLHDLLRGSLREWAESAIGESALQAVGISNHARVNELWQAHLSGRADHTARLWSLLVLSDWASRGGL